MCTLTTFASAYLYWCAQAFESFLLEHYPKVVQVSASAITSLFDTFNTSGSGLMNFDELVKGLSTLLRGTPKEKATLLFGLFDVHGLGASGTSAPPPPVPSVL